MSKTVMLIHGAWLTPASWNLFRRRYEAQGYDVIADYAIEWAAEHAHTHAGRKTTSVPATSRPCVVQADPGITNERPSR